MDEEPSTARDQYTSLRRKFKSQQNVPSTQEYRKLIQQYDSTRKAVKSLMRERTYALARFLQDKLSVLSSRTKTKDVTKKRPKVETVAREEPVTPTNFMAQGV